MMDEDDYVDGAFFSRCLSNISRAELENGSCDRLRAKRRGFHPMETLKNSSIYLYSQEVLTFHMLAGIAQTIYL